LVITPQGHVECNCFAYSFALAGASREKLADTKFSTLEYKEPPKKTEEKGAGK